MKKTEFKVHSIYSKEDILQMQKVATGKLRRNSLVVTIALFLIYVGIVLWEMKNGEGYASIFSFVSGGVLNAVLLAALLLSIVMVISLPYMQRNKILKSVPGGVLKVNYYFYEKTFQYGWGENFVTVGYKEIEDFRELPNTFFFKARGTAYWVKKEDFEVGSPEKFLEFISGKIK